MLRRGATREGAAVNFRAKAWAIGAAAALLLAGTAAAQQAPGNFYAGVAYGQSLAKDACRGLVGCRDDDDAFGAFAGYWLYPVLAIEGGYHNLGSIEASGGTYIQSNVWELLALAGWRPVSRLMLYSKFGVYRGAQTGGGVFEGPKQRASTITFAFGAQVDLTRRLGVRGEWQKYPRMGGGPILPRGDIDVVRAAAVLRF
jgi:outer membrane immunogenic protein